MLRSVWVQALILAAAVVVFGLLTHQDPGFYAVLAVVIGASSYRTWRASRRAGPSGSSE